MNILLLPIFLFGLVISWIVYLGVQQANESTLAAQRISDTEEDRDSAMDGISPRAVAQQR